MSMEHLPWHTRDLISAARNTYIDFVSVRKTKYEHEVATKEWYDIVQRVADELDLTWSNARAVILCQTPTSTH